MQPADDTAERPRSPASPTRRHNLSFVRRHLPPPPCRILEVGCGDGELAADLSASGYEVVALDLDPEAVVAARRRGVQALERDFLDFEAEPFGALLFPRSLHHIAPLDAALDRAHLLLVQGGTLVADEFAFDRMDDATGTWLYGLRSALAAAGAVPVAEEDDPGIGPLERWLRAHHHDPALSPGTAMVQGIERRFELTWRADVCYLYRYFHFWMLDHPRRNGVVHAIFDQEQRLVRLGTIRPLGLQLVAKKTRGASGLR